MQAQRDDCNCMMRCLHYEYVINNRYIHTFILIFERKAHVRLKFTIHILVMAINNDMYFHDRKQHKPIFYDGFFWGVNMSRRKLAFVFLKKY